eukprot:TRINITY_DN4602_c0_g1_i2.p1 TRINITY_DN4602_c0_g1~~TRINITY_DN4602_c0_g1_i2.p1  ORF type:complete len:135 (-),score=25.63 TRINITY_DN4602_c0_g1_i2:381-785(-)
MCRFTVPCTSASPKTVPSADVVPLPVWSLAPHELARKKAVELSKSNDMQNFLTLVAAIVMNNGKLQYAPEVGRQLPEEVQAWLRYHDLRMCSLLAYYPYDFKVHKAGRGRRIECIRQKTAQGIYAFVLDGVLSV